MLSYDELSNLNINDSVYQITINYLDDFKSFTVNEFKLIEIKNDVMLFKCNQVYMIPPSKLLNNRFYINSEINNIVIKDNVKYVLNLIKLHNNYNKDYYILKKLYSHIVPELFLF